MLHTWEARRFEKVLSGGRTKPLLIDCERTEGRRSMRERFVVKAIGLPEVHEYTLCNEVFGATIARWCGVPATDPALINISDEFIDANADVFASRAIKIRPGTAVGSAYLPGMLPMSRNPVPRTDDVPVETAIYALDMAIQNPDRRAVNPNCGYDGGVITAYDFESAFSFRFAILKPHPWAVTKFPFRSEHVFFRVLRESTVDWTPFINAFREIDPAGVDHLCGTIPAGWLPAAQPIVEHMIVLREHVDDFEGELGRSLI